MSKRIHTIQSSDKKEFDERVNLFLELGGELLDGGYEVIKNDDSVVYSQVVTFDIKKYGVEFYNNGQLRYWGPMHNILDKPSRNGSFISWYENGQREQEGSHKDGERWGRWTWWYENGHKKEEGSWKIGKVGEWFEWYENGRMEKSEIYKEGERDGRFTYYDKNGKMISDGYYGDGKRYTMYKNDT